MKLSCLPVSLYEDIFSGKKSVVDWVRFATTLGLDGVDLSVKFFPTQEEQGYATRAYPYDALRQEIKMTGLELCTLVCYPDLTHPDAGQRAREIEQMKADVRLAAELGVRFVRVTAGQRHPGLQREQGIRWVIEGFRQGLDEAERLGITLAYENHTKGAPWQYWDFSQPAAIFLEILNALNGTPLRVCFDTANPLVIGEDAIALLEAVKERVVIVHAFDIRTVGAFEPVRPGTGVAPIKQAFSILKASGFDGWVSVEEASRTGKDGFEKAVAFVRGAWEKA